MIVTSPPAAVALPYGGSSTRPSPWRLYPLTPVQVLPAAGALQLTKVTVLTLNTGSKETFNVHPNSEARRSVQTTGSQDPVPIPAGAEQLVRPAATALSKWPSQSTKSYCWALEGSGVDDTDVGEELDGDGSQAIIEPAENAATIRLSRMLQRVVVMVVMGQLLGKRVVIARRANVNGFLVSIRMLGSRESRVNR